MSYRIKAIQSEVAICGDCDVSYKRDGPNEEEEQRKKIVLALVAASHLLFLSFDLSFDL